MADKVLMILNSLNRTHLQAYFETRTLDVPYADHFYQAETWHLLAPSENSIKCILR